MSNLPLDQILLGDNLQLLANLPERSVDLVFARPSLTTSNCNTNCGGPTRRLWTL